MNLDKFTQNTHGGTRPGAGRPKVSELRKSRQIRLNDTELQAVKKFIKVLRSRPHRGNPVDPTEATILKIKTPT